MNSSPKTCTSPFTATQWQELEHQALIFKHMVSGVPIPPDLIFSVKRSLDSSISARLFPHQPIGWGCFEMGFGRKTDPEPGRCRRTDGKKWRCSKEAYPDSKYCERHMHRGRNRSRKPVEISSTPPTQTPTPLILTSTRTLSSSSPTPTSSSYPLSTLSSSSSLTSETQSYHQPPPPAYHESSIHPFLYSQSSSRTPCSDFSSNNTNPQLFLYSGTHSQADKDYRDISGPREGVGMQAFFPSVADSARSIAEVYSQPIGMDSYKGCSQYVSQNHQIYSSKQARQQQEQHCFVLGTDFNKSSRSAKTEEEDEDAETQKPLLHFFEDCPPKTSDSWLDLASNSSIQSGNFIGL
ncbi:growth-regulating factor 5 isoform X1 [Cucumis melo var. makuwa]|uniref:Growth-regulating factor n=1 Tax=Cucumis melo var. makuwa TaxID=1194695 RepID=A0A5D3C5L5_CUCMM|nr:growth-regulating factor 5 isoform X1 [Cucumis melo var. makuwa]